MEEVIVLEILEKSGKVRERTRLRDFPVTVGRAYDNDIILDDEQVSPHHLVIGRNDQGELLASDADSENGLFQLPGRKRVTAMVLASDNLLLAGTTHLRLRRPDCAVAPTVRTSRNGQAAHRLLASGKLFLLLLLLVAGMSWLDRYLMTFQKPKYQELVLTTLLPVLVLLLWSGIWAFVGRILVHRASYVVHSNMVLTCFLAVFGLDYLIEYYRFAFSAETSAQLIDAVMLACAGGLLLYGHLHQATQLRRKGSATTASLIAGSLLGLTLFANHIEATRFSPVLTYPSTLKPASAMIGRPLSPEAFFAGAHAMQPLLEQDRLDDSN